MQGSSRGSRRAGSALLTVLWLTAALAAIGLAVANNVRGETERAATNVDDVKSYFVARGAIQRAALHYLWGRDFYVPGYPSMELDFPSAVAHVDLIPESSKLSLNTARPEELMRLFIALGVPEGQASGIVAAILDWRTPDPLHQSAFDSFYLAQSPSFLPRHASFQENEELLQVKGITPELYFGSALDSNRAGLRDCVSAYSNEGSMDINTAQPAVLVAIGLTPADAAAIVKIRTQRSVVDFQQLAEIVQAVGPAGGRLRIGGQTTYTLRATARLKQPDGKLSDMRRTVAALVKIYLPGNLENKPTGFEIVRWFDRA
jgi:general secretion pathway protein K